MCSDPEKLEEIFNKVNSNWSIDLPCPYGDGNSARKIVDILKEEIIKE